MDTTKAGRHGIPQFDILCLKLRRFHGDFGELDFCHDASLAS
jgi:hypothetical protein